MFTNQVEPGDGLLILDWAMLRLWRRWSQCSKHSEGARCSKNQSDWASLQCIYIYICIRQYNKIWCIQNMFKVKTDGVGQGRGSQTERYVPPCPSYSPDRLATQVNRRILRAFSQGQTRKQRLIVYYQWISAQKEEKQTPAPNVSLYFQYFAAIVVWIYTTELLAIN